MQPVHDAGFLQPQSETKKTAHPNYLKWTILTLIAAVNGYATILMYAQGETAFALLTVFLTALAVFIFGSNKTYAHRYIYPGIAGWLSSSSSHWFIPWVWRLPTTAPQTS